MKSFKIGFCLLVVFLLPIAFVNAQVPVSDKHEIRPGVPLDPYDRGANDEQIADNKARDIQVMTDYYVGNNTSNDCFRIKEVSGASCQLDKNLKVDVGGEEIYPCRDLRDWMGIPERVPYNGYYVSRQIIETPSAEWSTRYLKKKHVQGYMAQAEQSLIDGGMEGAQKTAIDRLVAIMSKLNQPGAEGLSANKAEFAKQREKVASLLRSGEGDTPGMSLLNHRMRNPFSRSGNHMEMHVMPSYFHATHLDHFEDIWIHRGAINSWIPVVPHVPIWFSEFAKHNLIIRYTELARGTYPEISDFMAPEGELDNCLKMKLTSLSMPSAFEGPLSKIVGSDEHCFPGMYGPIFSVPLNFDKENMRPAQTAAKQAAVGLLLANILGDSIGVHNPEGEQAAFHRPTLVDTKERKHDLMQFLDGPRQLIHAGCFNPEENEHFLTTELWGSDYKEANQAGSYVTGHYYYVQGCPRCYSPTPGSPAPILG